ncbi:MAG: bifunctional tetrahydrofolate synthase/dihydrofolate synthase [Chromatiales bacterium]|nr:bifunctional tetrahydrofolate synthase/dihydrofolate synthase [Chromatiales bacterium]
MARFQNLGDWLAWLETAHPKPIELGLDRVSAVYARLGRSAHAPWPVITVAGTNGKGSTVALLESTYRCAGYSTAAYTSPHLLRFNERIRVNAEPVGDETIVAALARVDAARGDVSLSYFEFTTLAALEIFHQRVPDVVLLEVGLGGRLDAVNIVDADVAVITSIGLDHTEWLGADRDHIGAEKAGIARAHRPVIVGDRDPPAGLMHALHAVDARIFRIGHEFDARVRAAGWDWHGLVRVRSGLPPPALVGARQIDNAAVALAAIEQLAGRLPVSQQAAREGMLEVSLPGRFQSLPGRGTFIVDVCHNPQAAATLAQTLAKQPVSGRQIALFAALADKDIAGIGAELAQVFDEWHIVALPGPRAAPVESIRDDLKRGGVRASMHTHAEAPVTVARELRERAAPGDRIVAFGSFLVAAGLLDPSGGLVSGYLAAGTAPQLPEQ